MRIPRKRLAKASMEDIMKNPAKYYRFIKINTKELRDPIIIQTNNTQIEVKKILEVNIRRTLWLAPLRLATILLELL